MDNVLEYKCPACGGILEFDTASQKMRCPYCESNFEVAQIEQATDNNATENQMPKWDMADNSWDTGETDNLNIFTCSSCGGEIVGDENTAASECPFCGNQVVITGRFEGSLKPDFVIPFKLDKNMAKQKYKEHISGKFLLPKEFKDQNHINEIKGVYVPFWLYSANVSATADYTAERVRHWSDKKYNYTETSIFNVHRSGTMGFERIPCDGSLKMDDDLMESIEPFDFADAVPFQKAYLSGFFADKYDVDQYENQNRANDRILNSAVEVIEDTFRANYTSVQRNNSYMRVVEGVVKYALYPVWLLTSTYKGEKYTFAMNGQTGKFVGNLPINKKKRNITAAGIFAAASAIATTVVYFFFG